MTENTTRDRLSPIARRGLQALLLLATGGRCAVCSVVLLLDAPAKDRRRFVVSHVRPALGSKREGWASRNLFAGCGRCNDLTGKRDLTGAVPAFDFPDAVIAWTDAEVLAFGRTVPVAADADDDGLDAHRHEVLSHA